VSLRVGFSGGHIITKSGFFAKDRAETRIRRGSRLLAWRDMQGILA